MREPRFATFCARALVGLLATGYLAGPAARAQSSSVAAADESVLFQQFTYPIDPLPANVSWWRFAAGQLPELARLGVAAVWAPVPTKGGSGGHSMGYDPYDYYDLGAKNQKGVTATRFGTKEEYLRYVAVAHANGLKVYADVVLNHSGGADQTEENPLMARLGWDDIPNDAAVPAGYLPPGHQAGTTNARSWTRFLPVGANGKPGAGRFPRNFRHFHPSAVHPDRNDPYHSKNFGEDYCFEADNGYVAKGLSDWGAWLRSQTGVDGYRLDAVKHVEPDFLDAFTRRARTSSAPGSFFVVGEYWDTNPDLLRSFQSATHRQMSLFDFGLFYALWDMTEKPGEFDMNVLLSKRLADRTRAVTFVSNHDVDRAQPINRKKRRLPYAISLAMAGRPSVFYRDYFGPEDTNLPATLRALVAAHNRFAHGNEIVRFVDADLLVLERGPGNLLAAFNDGGKDGKPRTITVSTGFGAHARLRTVGLAPGEVERRVTTDSDGRAAFFVPPGGYVLLARGSADATSEAARPRPAALSTTQTTQFADDLDTARLGNAWREVPVTLAEGSSLTARVAGTSRIPGTPPCLLLIELRADKGGRVVAQVEGRRGADALLRLRAAPAAGRYRLRVRAPGPPTTGRVTLTYRAPARLL